MTATMTATRTRARRRTALTALLWQAIGVGAFLLAWELTAAQVGNDAVLPGPRVVLWDMQQNFAGSPALTYLGLEQTSYLANISYTVTIAALAWFVGSALGVVVGLLTARWQSVRDLAEPVLYVFGAVPVLVASPFFLIWFGFGETGQFALVAFYCFTLVAVVAQSAALSIPPAVEEYAAALGLSPMARFRSVVVPSTLPAILGALRTALGTAWGLQAIAELLGSAAGVGRVIAVRTDTGNVAAVIALIVALGLVALVCDLVLRLLFTRLLRWQEVH